MGNGVVERARTATAAAMRSLPSFPAHKPVTQVLNLLFLWLGCDPLVTVRMRLGHFMKVDLRTWTERYAYFCGKYHDEEQLRAVLPLIPPNAVVLDVGANIGFFAVPFARHVSHGEGRLYAFEPLATNVARLRENLALNSIDERTAVVCAFGLSSEHGSKQLTLREDFARGAETGNASILIEDGADEVFRAVAIEVETLDDFRAREGMESIDFAKVDIEGHEDMFLQGAAQTVAECRPTLLMEVNKSYFRRRGVSLFRRLDELLPPAYERLRCDAGRWHVTRDETSFRELDHVLLVPQEKLDAMASMLA
jgi:FkbM family methyltransferase